MTDWYYPTAFSSWRHGDGGEESAAIDRILRSGRYTMGPETEAFEAEIAVYHGRKHAVAVNSGSSANLVAVAALFEMYHLVSDSTVMVPAIAWATTYAPLAQRNVRLLLTDVDATWNTPLHETVAVDPASHGWPTRRPSPSLLVHCPVLGNPAHSREARESADKLGIWLLEDACESFGARDYNGKLCGTFGHLSTGSGFYSHQLSAIELGWVLTDNDELARLCRLLRNHGNDGWGAEDFDRSYNFVLHGYNLRPVEMHCAVAREQLRKQDDFAKERRRNWRMFADLARGLPIRMQEMRGDPNPFGIALQVKDNETRKKVVANLRGDGIDCRLPTGGSFTRHKFGEQWKDQPTPHADQIHDSGLFLGNAPFPIDRLIEKTIKSLQKILG